MKVEDLEQQLLEETERKVQRNLHKRWQEESSNTSTNRFNSFKRAASPSPELLLVFAELLLFHLPPPDQPLSLQISQHLDVLRALNESVIREITDIFNSHCETLYYLKHFYFFNFSLMFKGLY